MYFFVFRNYSKAPCSSFRNLLAVRLWHIAVTCCRWKCVCVGVLCVPGETKTQNWLYASSNVLLRSDIFFIYTFKGRVQLLYSNLLLWQKNHYELFVSIRYTEWDWITSLFFLIKIVLFLRYFGAMKIKCFKTKIITLINVFTLIDTSAI